VLGGVDGAHPAAAEALEDAVAPVDDGADPRVRCARWFDTPWCRDAVVAIRVLFERGVVPRLGCTDHAVTLSDAVRDV